MTTLTLGYRAIQNKVSSIELSRINWKGIYLSGILLSLLMLFFYMFSVNQLTEGTYLIKNYNKEINTLSEENRVLQANFANSEFLGQVIERAEQLSFKKTTSVKYIEILESSLAQAQPR